MIKGMKTQNIILGNTRQAGGKLRVENWQIRLSKILVAVMVSMVISCQKDINLESTPETETETEVILTIRVPGGAAKMEQTGEEFLSRAMTPVQENTISQVHVLLFSGGNLQSIREGNNIQNVDDNNRRFNARLNKGTFDLMIVANSGTQVATLMEGITLAEVETALRITQTTKWNDNNPIPLWGELNNAIIDVGAQLSIIKMSRALTKIDILVDAGAQDNFTLQTVSVYHWQQIGALIPNPRPTADYVTQPTVTGSGLVADTTVLKYLSNDLTTPGRALESSIYINETPNPGISAFPVMPCLVVGGIVDGEMRYYRIDYTETSSSGTTYRDLLRNWHYQIVIKNIITNGLPTEEEAYKSTEVSINAEIIPWEEGNMGNVIIDGTTWLRVDPGEFKLSREERTATRAEYHIDDNELVIKSNVDWSIDQSTIIYNPTNQTNWLNLSQWSGNANTKYDMKIYVAANTGTVQRTATFTVTAGTIHYQVVVTQTTEPMISLTVAGHNFSTSPTFHLDYKKYGEQRIVELDVEWYPADWDCKVSLALSGSYQPLEIMSGITDGEVLTGGKNISFL